MGDLKDEDHPVEATAYVAVAAAILENKNKNDYSIPLSIEHIDVAFYFFCKRRIEKPHAFSQNFTTTDTMFWSKM
ncbi:uncharacterized protein LOC117929162 isoform X4 [Vitis riparia]|uniref:uncharacterized protein LOC117929162 isoform X4 n=1 Tax=Vitis riparia TaxID=96939 RepID=UPI00155A903E|nr:uncharacterized protein LOC117929162 isoform X4 [Vitis riparia]